MGFDFYFRASLELLLQALNESATRLEHEANLLLEVVGFQRLEFLWSWPLFIFRDEILLLYILCEISHQIFTLLAESVT